MSLYTYYIDKYEIIHHIYIYIYYIYIYIIYIYYIYIYYIYIYIYCESQLSSLAEVDHCERSENRGSGGRWPQNRSFWGTSPANSGGLGSRFWGRCTMWQLGDGGLRFPLVRPSTCIGGPGMEGKMKQERSQNIRKAMEELEKINGKGNRRRKCMVRIGVPGRGV